MGLGLITARGWVYRSSHDRNLTFSQIGRNVMERMNFKIAAVSALSVLPWLYWVFVVLPTTGAALEGVYYIAAAIGLVSFCFTGPLTAALLLAKQGMYRGFASTFWLVSAPTILFQGIAFSASVMPLLLPSSVFAKPLPTMIEYTFLAVLWYAIIFLLLRALGKGGERALLSLCATTAILPALFFVARFLR